MLQPTAGLQLVLGLHHGRVTVPQSGVIPGETVISPDDPLPTRREWDNSVFFGILFDTNVFAKIFKGG